MVLIMQDKQTLVFHEEEVELPVPYQCLEMMKNTNIHYGLLIPKNSSGHDELFVADRKWTTFRRQHFKMYFPQWKCLNFNSNFTEVCS